MRRIAIAQFHAVLSDLKDMLSDRPLAKCLRRLEVGSEGLQQTWTDEQPPAALEVFLTPNRFDSPGDLSTCRSKHKTFVRLGA